MIRSAERRDVERITEIYNRAIASKRATSDLEPFTAGQRGEWLDGLLSNGRTPVFVCVDGDDVVEGYCYLAAYRPGRQALSTVAEVSCYIDYNRRREGVGGKLLEFTIEKSKELGYKTLIAIILSCNEASASLLQKFGFALWGVLPDVSLIGESAFSHLYYGLKL